MSKIAFENNVKPELFKAFINDFANALYPAYEEASGSGNIKIANVNQRLKVMFVAMCNYFGWNIDEIGKPFEDTWTWDAITSENSEVDDDTASTDEIDVIANDEGKLMNYPINRFVVDDMGGVYDMLVGNLMCVRHNSEGEFTSIREEDIPVIEKHLVAIMPESICSKTCR